MPAKSGKSVQNSVQKCAQKSWKLFVQNYQKVEKFTQKMSFTQAKVDFKQVFAIFYHNFHTLFLSIYSLLNDSFTLFTHRTTNTTITFNNKEGINF